MRKPFRRPGSDNYQIIVNGVQQSSRTSNLQAAEALQEKLNRPAISAVIAGNADDSERPHAWAELVLEWKKLKHKKASWEMDRLKLLWLEPHLIGVTDIRTIKRSTIANILESNRVIDRAGPCPQNSTANRFVALVQAMLNIARDDLEWMEAAPKLRKYQEPNSPMIALTLEKWLALKKELPAHLADPALFSIATGLRKDKVFKAEWSWINFAERRLTFEGRGNKLGNSIPLNDTAMEILTRIYNGRFRHIRRIFLYKRTAKPGGSREPTLQPLSNYGMGWYKAMERAGFGSLNQRTDEAGVEHREWDGAFHWHGFRKTFATWLRIGGAPNHDIDELCGWSAGATRDKYIGMEMKQKPIDHLRRSAGIVDRVLAGAVKLDAGAIAADKTGLGEDDSEGLAEAV